MKNLYLIFLVFLFITCNKEEGSLFLDGCQGECDEWERCINVSMFPSVDMRCRPLLSIYYSGYWNGQLNIVCLLYTSPSPRDGLLSRMPSSA